LLKEQKPYIQQKIAIISEALNHLNINSMMPAAAIKASNKDQPIVQYAFANLREVKKSLFCRAN